MVAESGARLLDEDAQGALIAEIVPRASVLTPNLPEARVLAGSQATGEDGLQGDTAQVDAGGDRAEGAAADAEAAELARAVLALGVDAVVLTGGHRARAVDLFLDSDEQVVEISGERHADGAAHGSGCTHSSVLAARLALGDTPLRAARVARMLSGEAIANGLRDIGAGAGPVDVVGLAAHRGIPRVP
jgi:hydroxymethylpyrimidine/phosphomethylpyrimidine kinase